MDLQASCNVCFSINRKAGMHQKSLFPRSINVPLNRLKTKSQLRTVESVNGDAQSLSVRTHKVTVHDRERDVVHEFYVPEVLALYFCNLAMSSQSIWLPDFFKANQVVM